MNDREPLPCPGCGGSDIKTDGIEDWEEDDGRCCYYYCDTDECGLYGPNAGSPKEALNKWNGLPRWTVGAIAIQDTKRLEFLEEALKAGKIDITGRNGGCIVTVEAPGLFWYGFAKPTVRESIDGVMNKGLMDGIPATPELKQVIKELGN